MMKKKNNIHETKSILSCLGTNNLIGKLIFRLVLPFALISLTSLGYAQAPTYFTLNNENINVEDFNNKINYMLDQVGVPALSMAIIENNEVVFFNNYGKKSLKNNIATDSKTVFEAASLTKMYLVFVVHKLVEKKLLDLDKPIYQYLEYEPLRHDDRYKLITSRMILSHCSGIENWSWNNRDNLLEILSNPGERFVYSGEGFQYLAKVVEVILNESYESYVTRMILKPFDLNDTYLKFKKLRLNPFVKESPSNYAVGHNIFGEEVKKWKNHITVPASGTHTTGKDYAKFMISFFDEKKLSKERRNDIIKPVIRLGEDDASGFMGSGFFMLQNEKDTIISFSGNNDGFRDELFYSVTHKRGFVFFTNSDQGKLITKELNKITTNFDIDVLFDEAFFKYYPSNAITLQNVYKEEKVLGVLEKVEQLKKDGKLDESTLNELGEIFKEKETDMSIQLLKENIALYPESPNAYGLLGSIYMNMKKYKLAHTNFLKAKELDFNLWNVQEDIEICQEKIE